MIHIYIDLLNRRLTLFDGQQAAGQYPVAIGKPETPTPTGSFTILNKVVNPGGALGTRWMGFTYEQHGIHGTNAPHLIGRAVSNGCVRMYNQDVEAIFPLVSIGTPVDIGYGPFGQGHNGGETAYSGENTATDYQIYRVQSGDTLWDIARRFSVPLEALIQHNNLANPDYLEVGQEIRIPRR